MWYFTEADEDSRNLKDPAAYTVQSHGDLSLRQIFIRELLQNALDNRIDDSKVCVAFRIEYLKGEKKKNLLQAIDFENLASHIEAVRNEQSSELGKPNVNDPNMIVAEDKVSDQFFGYYRINLSVTDRRILRFSDNDQRFGITVPHTADFYHRAVKSAFPDFFPQSILDFQCTGCSSTGSRADKDYRTSAAP